MATKILGISVMIFPCATPPGVSKKFSTCEYSSSEPIPCAPPPPIATDHTFFVDGASPPNTRWNEYQRYRNREALFAEIQPVALANCEFERFGDSHDGGYLACHNLLSAAKSVYSYGINNSDEWGCDLAARVNVPVHQYDCFNIKRPGCESSGMVFHEECIGPARLTDGGHVFDTLEAQIDSNGDKGKNLIVKMDVEGAEWPSLLEAPDAVLNQFDQLTVEFHDVHEAQYVETIRRVKRLFHVANVHYNNYLCDPAAAPLPSLAFEILFVNKNLGVVDPTGTVVLPHALDSPNNPRLPDCQTPP